METENQMSLCPSLFLYCIHLYSEIVTIKTVSMFHRDPEPKTCKWQQKLPLTEGNVDEEQAHMGREGGMEQGEWQKEE